MIRIDGSQGGGQILRSSLTLSLITGQPFHITQIRGQRPKPGLKRQHLTCVQAAMDVGGGSADGDELDSRELVFHPGKVQGGDYHIRISTAGSTTLVLQTIFLALLGVKEASTVVIEGGTHNPMAPPVDHLQKVYLPILGRMGANVDLTLNRHGFAPAGGGRLTAQIEPSTWTPINLEDRGVLRETWAHVLAAHLDERVAEREQRALMKQLGWKSESIQIETITDSAGPGNVIMVGGKWKHVSELVTVHGERGRTSETVAKEAAKEFVRYQNAEAPVGRRLADQLLLPFALAGGGRFRTLPVSNHFETNRHVIETFLPIRIRTEEEARSTVLVEIEST